MADPRRLFEGKDVQTACLYAKRLTGAEDAYPVLAMADGSLIVTITAGNLSFSQATTAVTVSNAVGNPVNVSLTSTAVTVSNTAGTVTNSVSTIQIISRTLTGSSGSIAVTNATISITPTNKIKVYAFSLTTTSSTEVTCVFHSGSVANGLELWRTTIMSPTGASGGANLAIAPPAFLFASRSGTAVSLSLSSAVLVHYSISYFEEA